jgi:hypothetical protein
MSVLHKWMHTRFLLLLLLMILPACGPGNPLGRRAIDGRITLDGSPLESGHIQFIPQASGGVSSGAIIAQGGYELETLKGLPPGKYHVQIFSPQPMPDTAQHNGSPGAATGALRPGIELIPAKYNTTTTLAADVARSGSTTFDFDLKSK